MDRVWVLYLYPGHTTEVGKYLSVFCAGKAGAQIAGNAPNVQGVKKLAGMLAVGGSRCGVPPFPGENNIRERARA